MAPLTHRLAGLILAAKTGGDIKRPPCHHPLAHIAQFSAFCNIAGMSTGDRPHPSNPRSYGAYRAIHHWRSLMAGRRVPDKCPMSPPAPVLPSYAVSGGSAACRASGLCPSGDGRGAGFTSQLPDDMQTLSKSWMVPLPHVRAAKFKLLY